MEQEELFSGGAGRPRRRFWVAGLGLLVAGGIAGGILAGVISANAAAGTGSAPAAASTAAAGAPSGLDSTGTVTAVGGSTVTIKTGSGTKTYSVTGSSDIDKNGEATLSAVKVGDAVRFSTTAGGASIDRLHAGSEQLDLPQGGPGQ
jgi:outer membrane lipoprotein SlyB